MKHQQLRRQCNATRIRRSPTKRAHERIVTGHRGPTGRGDTQTRARDYLRCVGSAGPRVGASWARWRESDGTGVVLLLLLRVREVHWRGGGDESPVGGGRPQGRMQRARCRWWPLMRSVQIERLRQLGQLRVQRRDHVGGGRRR